MQTTLLGLAIALILALVTALVGPFFVDWTRFRGEIETQASQLIGTPVRVSGPIEVRLLPSPSLDLLSVELPGDDARFSARAVRLELALGPLMRGDWRVSELEISEPRFRLGLDRDGRLRVPPITVGVDPDRLAIERLVVEYGRGVIEDGVSGASLTIDEFFFDGDLLSLAGPVKGKGRFIAAGDPYRFRIGSGRRGADGVKLHASLDAIERGLVAVADGKLRVTDGSPSFQGGVTVSRLAGVELPGGRTIASEPWRLAAQTMLDPRRLTVKQFAMQYGPKDRPFQLSGRGTIALGGEPRFAAALAAHRLDLDRLIGARASGWREPGAAVLAALRGLLEGGRAPLSGKLDVDFNTLMFGGAAWHTVRAKLGLERDRLDIETLSFRGPGLTQVALAGRLRSDGNGLEFAGPASIKSSDPAALASFIAGRSDKQPSPLGALSLSGDLTIGDRRVAVDRLKAEIDRKPIEGRIALLRGGADDRPRLEAELKAAEIDLDRAIALGEGALAGTGLGWPRDVTLALSIGKASYAGITASELETKMKLAASGLTVERFAIGNVAGARIAGKGSIDTSSAAPRGTVSVTLQAAHAEGLIALAARHLAPHAAEEMRRQAGRLESADLRARLDVAPAKPEQLRAGAPPGTQARLTLDGKLGSVMINLSASGVGDLAAPAAAAVDFAGSVEAKDGRVLAAFTGIDRLVAVGAQPASVQFDASGPLDGDVALNLKIAAGGLAGSAAGKVRRRHDGGVVGSTRLVLEARDARRLIDRGATAALPVSIDGLLGFAGRTLTLHGIKSTIAGSTVKGRLGLTVASPLAVDGNLTVTEIDAAQIVAFAIGAPQTRTAPDPPEGWSVEPFRRSWFGDLRGRIGFEAARVMLPAGLQARDLKGWIGFDGASLTLDGVAGRLADGPVTANAVFQSVPEGLSVRARLDLAKADLSEVTLGRNEPPASGTASLSAEFESVGLSPAALIGGMRGNGVLALDKAQITGLDPAAIDAAIAASDGGLALEQLSDHLGAALEAGRFAIPSAVSTIAIADGRVQLLPMVARAAGSDDAEVAISGSFDLSTETLDARLTLRGAPHAELPGRRPEVSVDLDGPLATPTRIIDTAALANFVTMRAVEREASRVKAAEREAKRRAEIAAAVARAEKERAERERAERERAEKERAARQRAAQRRAQAERLARERARSGNDPYWSNQDPYRTRRAPPPPQNRSFWDYFFGRQ